MHMIDFHHADGLALDDGTPANVAGLMAVLTTLTRMGLGRGALPASQATLAVEAAFPDADLDSGLVNTDELDLATLLDHADAYVLDEAIPEETRREVQVCLARIRVSA